MVAKKQGYTEDDFQTLLIKIVWYLAEFLVLKGKLNRQILRHI